MNQPPIRMDGQGKVRVLVCVLVWYDSLLLCSVWTTVLPMHLVIRQSSYLLLTTTEARAICERHHRSHNVWASNLLPSSSSSSIFNAHAVWLVGPRRSFSIHSAPTCWLPRIHLGCRGGRHHRTRGKALHPRHRLVYMSYCAPYLNVLFGRAVYKTSNKNTALIVFLFVHFNENESSYTALNLMLFLSGWWHCHWSRGRTFKLQLWSSQRRWVEVEQGRSWHRCYQWRWWLKSEWHSRQTFGSTQGCQISMRRNRILWLNYLNWFECFTLPNVLIVYLSHVPLSLSLEILRAAYNQTAM